MTTKTVEIRPGISVDIEDNAVKTTATLTGGGDASAANQTNVQANAGSDASKAISVQGIASGKPLPVNGGGFSITVTLTVTNGAYTVGDVVGGLISFANAVSAAGKRSIIHTITLSGVAALDYELWFFASDIATPALDNAVFTLAADDVAMCKGVIPIYSTDYKAPATGFNVATLRGVGFVFSCTATTLCAYLKAVATTPPGTTTLTLTIKGEFID